jgi:hypothetical protein
MTHELTKNLTDKFTDVSQMPFRCFIYHTTSQDFNPFHATHELTCLIALVWDWLSTARRSTSYYLEIYSKLFGYSTVEITRCYSNKTIMLKPARSSFNQSCRSCVSYLHFVRNDLSLSRCTSQSTAQLNDPVHHTLSLAPPPRDPNLIYNTAICCPH